MLKSINELADLTGKDRRTITARLADLPFEPGPKGAHLFESALALAAIYGADSSGKSLDQARTEQALEQAALTRVRREEAQRTRIPIEIPIGENDRLTQAVAAILKAARGKPLTLELINSLLAKFRDLPAKLKW